MNSDANKVLPNAVDETEPAAGFASVPVWLFVMIGVLFFWGEAYLDKHGGGFNPMVHEPFDSIMAVSDLQPKTGGDDELFAQGRKLFKLYGCNGCHQDSGLGELGKAPPLAGSEWVNAPGPNRIVRIVLNGLNGPIQVKGTEWNLQMLAWREVILKDEDIAGILTYIRKEWGNNAPAVKPEQVKAIRDATADRKDYWSAKELEAVPEAD